MKQKTSSLQETIVGIAVGLLVGRALREQLSLPPEQRTWQGAILGVPYDFRFPTWERLRRSVWNEDTSAILLPHAFGMGWSINFYPLFHPKDQ